MRLLQAPCPELFCLLLTPLHWRSSLGPIDAPRVTRIHGREKVQEKVQRRKHMSSALDTPDLAGFLLATTSSHPTLLNFQLVFIFVMGKGPFMPLLSTFYIFYGLDLTSLGLLPLFRHPKPRSCTIFIPSFNTKPWYNPCALARMRTDFI